MWRFERSQSDQERLVFLVPLADRLVPDAQDRNLESRIRYLPIVANDHEPLVLKEDVIHHMLRVLAMAWQPCNSVLSKVP